MALTKEQQYKLINRYQSGDKDAIKEIIAANEGLVWDSAYKYYKLVWQERFHPFRVEYELPIELY